MMQDYKLVKQLKTKPYKQTIFYDTHNGYKICCLKLSDETWRASIDCMHVEFEHPLFKPVYKAAKEYIDSMVYGTDYIPCPTVFMAPIRRHYLGRSKYRH